MTTLVEKRAMAEKTVFVTGGSGFVGGHLVRALVSRGDKVRALKRKTSDTRLVEDLPVEWVEGDLLQPSSYREALRDCHTVFHCAADYRLFSKDPSSMYEINVEGTRALLASCQEYEIPKVVYTSSVAALALPEPGQTSNEESRAQLDRVVGHYKKSKFLAQEVALELADSGLPVVLVNPSTPIGPGDLKPTATGKIVVDFLCRKMPAYLDTGLNLVPVEDVAAGHLLAEELGRDGELYILGHLNLTLKEILEMLAALTGLPAPKIKIPYGVAWAVGFLDTLVEGHGLNRTPQVPLEGVKMARKKMFFDPQKARDQLGFRPGSVREALGRAVDWFVRHGYAPDPKVAAR
jgi:dihydroflavonol-4-reductase